MKVVRRFLVGVLVFLVLSGLFVLSVVPVVVVVGQGVAMPSVPQFSVTIIGDYYYVPPSTITSIDPYTGEEIVNTQRGYYKDERDIAIVIKNQLFTPTDKDGNKYGLYYRFQCKGHFENEWYNVRLPTLQSSSDYTTVTSGGASLPDAGSQLDWRVEAIIGRELDISEATPVSAVYVAGFKSPYGNYEAVVSSGWSEVVTFTIPEPGEAITLPPTNTPPVNPPTLTSDITTFEPSNIPLPPQQTPWATYLLTVIVTVCIIAVPIVVVMYHNKYQHRKLKTLRLYSS